MELGDFGFLEEIIKDDKYKPIFKKAREKKNENNLIPDKKLFSLFTNVKESNFKGILYVPFKSEGLSLYLKEQTGKGFDELEKDGMLIVPRVLTYQNSEEGRLYHDFWAPLMDDLIKFIIKHDPRVYIWSSCDHEIKIKGVKVIEFNPFTFNYLEVTSPDDLTF